MNDLTFNDLTEINGGGVLGAVAGAVVGFDAGLVVGLGANALGANDNDVLGSAFAGAVAPTP